MKKALILTVWDAPNYGSFLQAEAMRIFLEEKNYDVKFIKYRTNLEEKKFLFEKKKQFLFHPIFSFNRALKFAKVHKKVKKINLNDISEDDYDLIIIGSDELWNLRNDKFFSKEYFYGGGFNENKILVYSISVGTGEKEDFQSYPSLKKLISCFDENISVRDEKTFSIVKSISNKNAKITCDPTYLVDKDKYIQEYNKRLPENFLVVYSYRISEKLRSNIVTFANKNNLKIVSLCNYYNFCNYNIACSPLEFSDIIKKSKYAIITTFHGTIFSIFNHKNFVCASDKQKTVDLLKKVGLVEQVISENESYNIFERKLLSQLDYNFVDKNIIKMKDESIEWLNSKISKLEEK